MRRMWCTVAALALIIGVTAWAQTPPQAKGFFGTMTGKVKSAKPDGTSFVLTVSSVEIDEAHSAVKDPAVMVGKVLTLGTRMPKSAAGVPGPHAADAAFIKDLRPGMEVTVKIFAVRTDPSVLRIMEPGTVTRPATAPTTQK